MSATYDRIARSRPRIRRDLLFTRTPDGVLFHNAEGGFALNSASAYRFASLLVPYLDGRHRVADICAPLPPSQREMVVELVTALYARDLARDVPLETNADADLPAGVARRFAAQLAYLDHYRDEPVARFRRFRDTPVAVLGSGPVARSCVRSLVRNGVARVGTLPAADRAVPGFDDIVAEARELTGDGSPAEVLLLGPGATALTWAELAAYEMVVVIDGEGAPGQTLRLLEPGIPAGRTLLPLWTFGDRAVAGPMSTAGSRGCWVCAALRLGGNGDPGAAADLWSGAGLPVIAPAPDHPPVGPVAAMLGNLLGYEIFRITTGALPAETEGKVIIQNLESLDVLSEDLLPHPACALCAPDRDESALPDLTTPAPTGLAEADLVAVVTGTPDVEPADPQAEAETILAELDERMVLVGRHAGVFTRFDDDAWTQTPLKVSTIEVSLGHARRRRIAAFDVHHVAGARRRALHTAAQTYAARAAYRADGRPLPGLPTVDPATLSIISGSGAGAGADDSARWCPATSLLTGERWQVPAGAVRPLGPDNRDRLFLAGPAGDGAGGTLAAAVWRGLRSALCHLAVQRSIRGLTRPRQVAPETAVGDPELEFLVKSAVNLGVELELLDLTPTGPAGTQVLLARYVEQSTGLTEWRASAHASWSRAAVDAVRDLLGVAQLRRQLPAGQPVDDGDPLLTDFDAGTLVVDGVVAARPDARHGWPDLAASVRESGHDALVVPTTPADLRIGGLVTARVLLARRVDG
ncbi:TOMM precursor leader peptide-binding protein [Micromonospora sp. NBC_01699]|uniref:TOMM precursor leader peptide-binding protein n=1 Tax=Micromonospora sp. NBC_01699 TaxID=2975984 RepID=UPI002E2A462E|nr:TOMM precursor leader peptide-binding protein [Micromonospora sp. NBC_01699]